MATTNRGYDTQATGSNVGTWGVVLNDNFGIIDNNLGGTVSIALSSSNVTLNTAQAQCGTIILTGTLSASVFVFFPNVSGWWTIINRCTVGAHGVFARCLALGAQIGLPPGEAVDIYTDGTNCGYRDLGRIGTYWDYAGFTVPIWISNSTVPPYLLCNGTTFSAVTYPVLFSILSGTTLPDARGRMRAMLDGGTNRITTSGSGINGVSLFASGGAQNTSLSTTHMAAYTPSGSVTGTFSGSGNSINAQVIALGSLGGGANVYYPVFPGGDIGVNVSGTISATFTGTANGGASTPFAIMPPTYIGGLTFIRAG